MYCMWTLLVVKVLKCTACGPLLVEKVLNVLHVDHFWLRRFFHMQYILKPSQPKVVHMRYILKPSQPKVSTCSTF